jgi:hypothetical protein
MIHSNPGRGRTVPKSFRIDEGALEALQEEADARALSVNTLANQLFVTYANFGRYLTRLSGVSLSEEALGRFVRNVPEDIAIEAGKTLGKTSPEILIAAKKMEGITVRGVIELIHNLSFCANWFQYTETRDGEHWKIILMHNLGRNWSLFIAHYIDGAFSSTDCRHKYEITDRYVTFTI